MRLQFIKFGDDEFSGLEKSPTLLCIYFLY